MLLLVDDSDEAFENAPWIKALVSESGFAAVVRSYVVQVYLSQVGSKVFDMLLCVLSRKIGCSIVPLSSPVHVV